MSKRVSAVRRKSPNRASKDSATSKQKASRQLPKKNAPAKAKKSATKKTSSSKVMKATQSKAASVKTKRKALTSASRPKATIAKESASKPSRTVKKAAQEKRAGVDLKVLTKSKEIIKTAEVVAKAKARMHGPPSSVLSPAPLTPRSIAPPAVDEAVYPAKARVRNPARAVVRAAYVSPAQRVLEAQQAAQTRARRVQQAKEDAPNRSELTPPSETAGSPEAAAISSEPKTSAAFVRRGRLGPRDPNSGPSSEPLVSPAGSFDKEWNLIKEAAHKASIKLERELVQGWLEPWLNGKDTLALIQSAIDSSDAYFIATQALMRRTLLVQRSASVAAEIAAHFTRLGLNVYALLGSDEERKSILSRFGSANFGTLVVPLDAFDDEALATEIQQVKINGLVAEEAQRVSELSFDFDVAYDRIPNMSRAWAGRLRSQFCARRLRACANISHIDWG